VPLKRCYDFWRNSWKSVDSAACSFHHLSFNGTTFDWLSSWFLFFLRSKGGICVYFFLLIITVRRTHGFGWHEGLK
jgi:hypothetical protein